MKCQQWYWTLFKCYRNKLLPWTKKDIYIILINNNIVYLVTDITVLL